MQGTQLCLFTGEPLPPEKPLTQAEHESAASVRAAEIQLSLALYRPVTDIMQQVTELCTSLTGIDFQFTPAPEPEPLAPRGSKPPEKKTRRYAKPAPTPRKKRPGRQIDITPEQIAEIRRDYSVNPTSYLKLAEETGFSATVIRKIVLKLAPYHNR